MVEVLILNSLMILYVFVILLITVFGTDYQNYKGLFELVI